MSGIGYEFPEIRLRGGDILVPDYFSNELVRAAEKLSGNLNEHAFEEDIVDLVEGEDGCFYKPTSASVIASMELGTGPTFSEPIFDTGNDAFPIPNSGSWAPITGLSVTIDTDNCMFWMASFANVLWQKNEDTSFNDDAAGFQTALRVDGIVLDWTISGQANSLNKNSRAWRALSQQVTNTALPGPSIPKTEIISGIGFSAWPDRIVAATIFPVANGSHTIEVVARRLSFSHIYSFSTEDVVWVFNRSLFVLEIPTSSQATNAAYEYEVTPFEAEDILETTALSQPLIDMAVSYNAVTNAMACKGALNHNHGFHAAYDYCHVEQIPSSIQLCRSTFTGETSTTITGSFDGTGWYCLYDGAGHVCRTDETHGDILTANKNCSVVILANAEVLDITTTASATAAIQYQYVAFALLYRMNGVDYMVPATFCTISPQNRTVDPATPTETLLPTATDVSILGVIDFTLSAPTHDIEYIGLYASTFASLGSPVVTLHYKRASMQVIVFRS